MTRTPALFVGHGAPLIAVDPARYAGLRAWGATLEKPRAVLIVSAHWEAAPVRLGAVERRPLIYDFGGFPQALYEVTYDSPGAPDLAGEVDALLGGVGVMPERGLDHGAWTPLMHLLPEADVPVLQLSMPSLMGPEAVMDLGRRLAPLREAGVMLIGSGNVTHNLRAIDPTAPLDVNRDPRARDFDAWTAQVIADHDLDALLDWRAQAPAPTWSHPSAEHWLPLLFTMGASQEDDAVAFPVTGWEGGGLSRRSAQLG